MSAIQYSLRFIHKIHSLFYPARSSWWAESCDVQVGMNRIEIHWNSIAIRLDSNFFCSAFLLPRKSSSLRFWIASHNSERVEWVELAHRTPNKLSCASGPIQNWFRTDSEVHHDDEGGWRRQHAPIRAAYQVSPLSVSDERSKSIQNESNECDMTVQTNFCSDALMHRRVTTSELQRFRTLERRLAVETVIQWNQLP